jgi:NADH:ubiquinone oxidoreductase subunit D
MQLYTQAASECEEPYKVIVKETKGLLQDYLNKNKQKRDALNRVKKEIEEAEKEEQLALQELELRKKDVETIKNTKVTVAVAEEPETEEEEEIVFPKKRTKKKKETPKPEVIEPVEKPKKRRGIQSVYETAVEFTF